MNEKDRAKRMMDLTQWDTIYAILDGIVAASEAADFNCCGRLAHAAKMVMTDLTVENPPKT